MSKGKVLIISLLTFTSLLSAQTNFEVKVAYSANNSTFDPFSSSSSFDESGNADVTFLLQILDANVQSIDVKLRRVGGGELLFEKSFEYGVAGQFNDGTSYTVNGDVIELALGTYTDLSTYLASLVLIYTDGSKSIPILKHKAPANTNISWGQ
ncbi:MAG: hypothetical protein GY751_04920 [Bacteroidetes bacterium]|nr:hypothetical protein [Bacteroidota bacterium]